MSIIEKKSSSISKKIKTNRFLPSPPPVKQRLELTVNECCRILEVSDVSFRNYVALGKIKRTQFNRYDPDICREQIKEFKDLKIKQREIRKRLKESSNNFPPDYEEPEIKSETEEEILNYVGIEENLRSSSLAYTGVGGNRSLSEATRIQAWQKVQREQLDSDIRTGKYVPLEEVNQYISTMQLKARDLFLRIAPELKDQIAQESDPVNVEYMITLEINRALSEMAEMKQEIVNAKTATGTIRRPVKE